MPETARPSWGWTVPVRGLLALVALAGASTLLIVSPGSPADRVQPVPVLVVDPNTAPPEVLGALPKLGPALVGRIVAARREAPFRSLEDLDVRVRGIGPATIAALRPHLAFDRGGPGDRHENPRPNSPMAQDAR